MILSNSSKKRIDEIVDQHMSASYFPGLAGGDAICKVVKDPRFSDCLTKNNRIHKNLTDQVERSVNAWKRKHLIRTGRDS